MGIMQILVCLGFLLLVQITALPRDALSPVRVGRTRATDETRKSFLGPHVMSMRGGEPPVRSESLEGRDSAELVFSVLRSASEGDLSTMKALLLDQGANVNSADYDNRTALHIAAAEGKDDVVKFLLKSGANPHLRDRWSYLPLDDAVRGNHRECVNYLQKAMVGGTLKGQARALYSQLLMRESDKFVPSWGEMIDMAQHSHVIAYDTENCAKGQIIEYDPAYLSLIGWLTRLSGTIFTMPVIHLQTMLLLCVSLFYALLCRPQGIGNDPIPIFPVFTGSTFGVSLVGGLLGFLLALFNSNGLDRWWQTRMQLGGLMGQLTDLALLVGTYVRPEIPVAASNEEKARLLARAKEYRETLVRWINLLHILVYRQARNIHDIQDLVCDTRYAESRQWLTHEEWGILQGKTRQNWEKGIDSDGFVLDAEGNRKVLAAAHSMMSHSLSGNPSNVTNAAEPANFPNRSVSFLNPEDPNVDANVNRAWNQKLYYASQELIPVKNKLMSRYMIVLYWMDRLFTRMSQEGFIAKGRPEALFKLQTCANNVRIATSTIFTYLYCKIPFIYVQLLTFMVKLYLVVIAVIAGSNIRVAKSHLERILPIFLVIVSNCAYEGILQIHVRLWNPLGMDINAFPVTKYLEYVWKTTHQNLEDDEAILPKVAFK